MKIAYVMESLAIMGGVERIMVSKMNSLADRYGHDLTLIEVYDIDAADKYQLSDNVRRVRLHVDKSRQLLLKPLQMFTVVRRVIRAVNEVKPDVMSCSALLGIIVYGLGSFSCRTIYESHGPRCFMVMPWLVRLMEKRVDMVVCLTQGDASEYTITNDVRVIPNFVGDEFFMPIKPHDKLHVSALGRLEEEKGFDLLIRSWKKVTASLPDAQLCIYGDGSLRDDLNMLITQLNLHNNVTLSPFIQDVRCVYADSSVVIVPSRFEGFSLVAVEAMAMGVPVVACDVEYGPREILAEGRGGVLVHRDEYALAEAVIKIIDNETYRNSLSKEARDVAACYRTDTIMNQWNELFKEIK